MFKSLFYRIRNCEHEPELSNCSQFVLRLSAANNSAPGDSPFPSADMVKFVLSRLDNCEDWVLMHHLCVPTRGTSTTQRVEAVHEGDGRRLQNCYVESVAARHKIFLEKSEDNKCYSKSPRCNFCPSRLRLWISLQNWICLSPHFLFLDQDLQSDSRQAPQ